MKKILLIALAALAMIAPVSCYPRSDASPAKVPTSSKVFRIQGCPRGAFPTVQQWFPGASPKVRLPFPLTGHAQYRLYANAYYWMCPGGPRPDRIKFYAYKFCAARISALSPPSPFNIRGFHYNAYFATEAGAVVNPGPHIFHWDGFGTSRYEDVCTKRRGIRHHAQVWMFRANNPWWELGGYIDQAHTGDTHFNFWFSGNRHYAPWPGDDRMRRP